jgi:hypothetical protein
MERLMTPLQPKFNLRMSKRRFQRGFLILFKQIIKISWWTHSSLMKTFSTSLNVFSNPYQMTFLCQLIGMDGSIMETF